MTSLETQSPFGNTDAMRAFILGPEGIDITIGTKEEMSNARVQAMEMGLKAEPEILEVSLKGINQGSLWTLQKYNITKKPRYKVLKRGQETAAGPYYSPDHNRICLPMTWLEEIPLYHLVYRYPINIGMYAGRINLEQESEWIGIEETTHYIASQEIDSTNTLIFPQRNEHSLPPTANGVDYYSQIYERQAIENVFEFFKQKYGENPLQNLELALLAANSIR